MGPRTVSQLEGSVTHSDLQEPRQPGQGGRTGAILRRSPEAMRRAGSTVWEAAPEPAGSAGSGVGSHQEAMLGPVPET